jgi:phosphate transport system substrate-binding protein
MNFVTPPRRLPRADRADTRDADVTTACAGGCRAPNRFVTFALATLALLAVARTADAAPQGAPLFADRDLGDALAQAVQGLGPDARRIEIKPSASAAACASAPGAAPRLALLAHAPSRAEIDRCSQTAAGEVYVVEIGRQAVALVVPLNSPVWRVDAAAVFRAFGQNASDAPRPTTWADIDPGLPRLPIGLLVPAPGSRTQHLFDALIMEPGCGRVATARMPFDLKSRTAFCAALRSDVPVAQRQGGARDVANWAAAAPPGQLAIVSIAELRQLDRRVVPLLLDGALPTAANIETGRYPAAEKLELMIVVPYAADRAQRNDARTMAFNLLAEASIGPTGSLAPAGLIPLPPPERIAARSQAVASLEQR